MTAVQVFEFIQFFLAVYVISFSSVFGCGQSPQGVGPVVNFVVNGSLLPAEMAYSGMANVQTQVPSISTSEQMAKTRVERAIMDAVMDVLEQQGRSALLPDAVISLILQQLTIDIRYNPLQCQSISIDGMQVNNFMANMREGCITKDGIITLLCEMGACMPSMMDQVKSVPREFTTITGSFRTTNIIMANWSRSMWESVLRRVLQRLATLSSPFGMFFSTASVTVNM